MEDWAEIRRLHRAEGIPVKAIARHLAISRNTVRSALASDKQLRTGMAVMTSVECGPSAADRDLGLAGPVPVRAPGWLVPLFCGLPGGVSRLCRSCPPVRGLAAGEPSRIASRFRGGEFADGLSERG